MTTFTMQDLNPEPTTPEPRSFWNHRVVDLTSKNDGDPFFLIQEVYYNEQGKPCGYCDPCLGGDNLDEIRTQIQRFTECLSQPILDASKDFNGNFLDDDTKGVEII
jgi:hypothetical protein